MSKFIFEYSRSIIPEEMFVQFRFICGMINKSPVALCLCLIFFPGIYYYRKFLYLRPMEYDVMIA